MTIKEVLNKPLDTLILIEIVLTLTLLAGYALYLTAPMFQLVFSN